jgi:hypothetical protein
VADTETDVLPVPAPALSLIDQRRKLLAEHGLMLEADYALMLGVTVKTLKNKPRSDLPDHVTIGRETFYRTRSVALKMSQTTPRRRRRMKA